MSTPALESLMRTLDVVVPLLLTLFAIACVSAACWLVSGLDNEDAGR